MVQAEKLGGVNVTAPKMQVKCGVDNCEYWREHYCTANAVEVNAMGDGHARTSEGTCCTTFKDKSFR